MRRDPNHARVMRALRRLRDRFPDAHSWSVTVRDDGTLRLEVNDREVA